MADCPSCGRYVGPYDACPYCGAALSRRTSVRYLKIVALILALGGLVVLWLLATQTDVSSVEIGQVNATMNMAYVRVEGRVTRATSYDPETGYFSFWLQDGSGELRVAVYRNESQALISQNQIPVLGDQVAVEGTLRVQEDYVSLTLNVPERLHISRSQPVARSIGDITTADAFARVQVRGRVRTLRSPYSGLTLVGLQDNTGEIELAVSEIITALDGGLPALAVGQSVEVIAPVSLYKDQAQLSLARAGDLLPLEDALTAAPELAIGQLKTNQVGEWIAVNGQVTDVETLSSGVKCRLDDGSGQITMLLWQNLYDQLAETDAPAVGTTLHVQGRVSEYKGELEIVPELPEDVNIQAFTSQVAALPVAPTVPPPDATSPPATATPRPAPTSTVTRAPTATPRPTATPADTPTPAVVTVPIGSLDANRSGEEVTISGQVVETASFSQGFKFTLDDGSGKIVLLMWHNVYDDCWHAPQLNIGATVQASGEIGQFEGELQIQPGFGGDVKVIAAGGPIAPQREIGSIGAYLGQRATIVGQITRVEGNDNGLRMFVSDGTGEILVFIWNNALERIVDNQALGTPGTRVRVAGVVQEYRSNLELLPVLPFDVAVLL
jgi:DNA/RNA endonuclease YhcR with UshA esterase domain